MGYIKDVKFDSNTHLIEPILYATCSTAAATAEKTANINNFHLISGVTIQIHFTYGNSAESPTLNISNTGAKTIYLNNSNISLWDAGDTVSFTYDSSNNGVWYINNYNKIEVVRL